MKPSIPLGTALGAVGGTGTVTGPPGVKLGRSHVLGVALGTSAGVGASP